MKQFEQQSYSDIWGNLFENLSEEERNKRIEEIGSKEGAIQQYGFELALKSMDKKEEELTTEEKEQFEKLEQGATNVIKCFALKRTSNNKKGENLLIVTDSGADKLMIKALWEAGREIARDDCHVIVAPETQHAAQEFQEFGETIGEKIKTADAVLLLTSLSRTHSKETGAILHPKHSSEVIASLMDSPALQNALQNLRGKYTPEELSGKLGSRKLCEDSMFSSKARIISITNTKREILTEGGSQEDPLVMAERIDKFAKVMEGVEKVKITSENGTDLELDIKVPTLIKETGIINKPGQGANFPSGEYGGAVDLQDTKGIYVVDGAVGMIGRVDRPIRITLENGLAVKIEGGEAAEKLQEILEKANKEYQEKNPQDKTTSAFRLAEFSFGMNSKAFRYTEKGERMSPPTSLEGEKGLGTIHLALGKNSIFNIDKNDSDYNDIPIHIDCVAMNTTIKGIKENKEEIEILKNGKVVCL